MPRGGKRQGAGRKRNLYKTIILHAYIPAEDKEKIVNFIKEIRKERTRLCKEKLLESS